MAYIMLGAAIALEVLGTSLLPPHRASPGSGRRCCVSAPTRPRSSCSRGSSSTCVGVVYATWSGMGIAAIMLIGATFLGEPLTLAKLAGAAMIIGGVVILNVAGVH